MTKYRNFLSVEEAIKRIERNGGRVSGYMIRKPDKCGLKVLSAIDALVNYHGYKVQKEQKV